MEELVMAKLNPKSRIEKLEKIENAQEQLAPAEEFGNIKLDTYKAQVQKSRDARKKIADLEQQMTAANNERDAEDEIGLAMAEKIVNGVIGNPNYGPDSSLYEAMGYVRKSERKSGLTRKKKGEETES
jgi:type IV secretory pathway VirB4 component